MRILVSLLLLSLLSGAYGCDPKSEAPAPAPEEDLDVPPELTEAFITRALAGINTRLKPTSKILELRVSGDVFSVQMQTKKNIPASEKKKVIPAGSLVQLDYIETPGAKGQPPLGQIRGPVRIEVKGDGEVKDNLYPFSEVDLPAIARAFRIAILAVDPEDGKVAKLVVRRNLPFGSRVRGRIFVRSPRMSGSIDVNEKGTPLKR